MSNSQRGNGDEWVSEYTAKRDIASVVLTAAKQMGLIDDDTIGLGSAGRFAMLDKDEKEALTFDSVAELSKLHKGDPGQQAKTIRAALKIAGTVMSELTNARLDHMAKQAAAARQRQQMIDDFAKRPEVQEQERGLAEFKRNSNRIHV